MDSLAGFLAAVFFLEGALPGRAARAAVGFFLELLDLLLAVFFFDFFLLAAFEADFFRVTLVFASLRFFDEGFPAFFELVFFRLV